MTIGEHLGRIGGAALALLPLCAAAALIAVFPRELSEAASAVVAAAAMLSLIAFFQLAALIRQTRRFAEKQEEVRAQALALARCMKALNQRMAALDPAGEAVEDIEAEPLSLPEPEPQPPAAKSVDPFLPLVTLAGGVWGWSLSGEGETCGSADAALSARLVAAAEALSDRKGRILVAADAPLSRTPRAAAMAAALATGDAEFRRRVLLGLPQKLLREGTGEAAALAGLARSGVGLALTNVADLAIDPAALAGCGIIAVEVEAALLISAARSKPAAKGLGAALAEAGVDLLCSDIDDRDLLAQMSRLGVAAVSGPAISLKDETVIIPWRAAPAPVAMTRGEPRFLRRAG